MREPIDSWEVRRALRAEEIAALQISEGQDVLPAASERLEAAGIPCAAEVLVGDIGPTIARHADEIGCDKSIMGSRDVSAISGLLLGTKIIPLAQVPVTIVN